MSLLCSDFDDVVKKREVVVFKPKTFINKWLDVSFQSSVTITNKTI